MLLVMMNTAIIANVALYKSTYTIIADATFHMSDCKKFIEEAMTMQEFNHAHVLSLIGIVVDGGENTSNPGEGSPRVSGFPMVVLPFMKHGDLLSYIRNEKNVSCLDVAVVLQSC